MYRLIFNQSKKLLPRISETELIALIAVVLILTVIFLAGDVDTTTILKNTIVDDKGRKGIR